MDSRKTIVGGIVLAFVVLSITGAISRTGEAAPTVEPDWYIMDVGKAVEREHFRP